MAWILTIWAFALTVTIGSNQSQSVQTIPPDHVRVQGAIVQFSSKTDASGLCQQYPCWALVKISRVIAYGSGFSKTLSAGDTIEVRFATTLLPTESLFPNRASHLQGLNSGESFQADVKQKLNLNTSNNNTYEVNEYEKMN